MNIHVGNLSREVTEDELRQTFEAFGEVVAVKIIKDRNGISRGFGFIEMSTDSEGQAAIEGLNGKELAGRTLDLSESHLPPGGRKGGRPYRGRAGGGKSGRGRGRR